VNVTVQVDTAPAATDFGSAPPAFGDAPTATPAPSAQAVDDPNRPLRRVKK